MIGSLALALVLSQTSPKVQIIRGGGKKAVKTETSATAQQQGPTPEQVAREQALEAKSAELNAKSDELNARADALKAKDAANEQKAQSDAKNRAAQAKILEKHSADLQREYEGAANALAGQE